MGIAKSETGTHLSGMEIWGAAGVAVCSHTSGLSYIDIRAGKLIRNQNTKHIVSSLVFLNQDNPNFFAGMGPELMQYDTRFWKDGNDSKPKAVAQWTMPAKVTALHAISSRRGSLLIGAG